MTMQNSRWAGQTGNVTTDNGRNRRSIRGWRWRQSFYKRMTGCQPQSTRGGFILSLYCCRESLTGWGWIRMSGKLWGWSTRNAGRRGYGQTNPIPGVWQGQGGATIRDIRISLSALSTGRNWQGGHWLRTYKPSTAWQRGNRDRRAMEKAGTTSPGRTGWRFWRKQVQGPTQLRGVVAGRQRGRPCGYTSGINMSRTPL